MLIYESKTDREEICGFCSPQEGAVGIYVLFTTSVIKRLVLRHSEQHKAVKEYVVSALIVIKRNVARIFGLQERRVKEA
jgi:hypothetical protein